MLRMSFEGFEFGSNGYNLHSNASNPFRYVRICIRMLQISGSNLHLNASNLVRMVRICIRISFEGLEFAFECFEFGSNG